MTEHLRKRNTSFLQPVCLFTVSSITYKWWWHIKNMNKPSSWPNWKRVLRSQSFPCTWQNTNSFHEFHKVLFCSCSLTNRICYRYVYISYAVIRSIRIYNLQHWDDVTWSTVGIATNLRICCIFWQHHPSNAKPCLRKPFPLVFFWSHSYRRGKETNPKTATFGRARLWWVCMPPLSTEMNKKTSLTNQK